MGLSCIVLFPDCKKLDGVAFGEAFALISLFVRVCLACFELVLAQDLKNNLRPLFFNHAPLQL